MVQVWTGYMHESKCGMLPGGGGIFQILQYNMSKFQYEEPASTTHA
jgi:hypothetical protein